MTYPSSTELSSQNPSSVASLDLVEVAILSTHVIPSNASMASPTASSSALTFSYIAQSILASSSSINEQSASYAPIGSPSTESSSMTGHIANASTVLLEPLLQSAASYSTSSFTFSTTGGSLYAAPSSSDISSLYDVVESYTFVQVTENQSTATWLAKL